MRSSYELRINEKLLLAAFELEKSGKRPFSAEDLVVSAWRKFPDAFGLAGHRGEDGQLCYPDSNRVFAEIMGSKPIRKRGLLKKVGTKMYQLTESGVEHAELLFNRLGDSQAGKSGLSRVTKGQLKKLFDSKAVEKYKRNQIEDITFYDACAFWGISPSSSKIQLEGRIANLNKVVESALKDTKGKMLTFEHGGRAYGEKDLNVLKEVNEELLQKFSKQIEIIKTRKYERPPSGKARLE